MDRRHDFIMHSLMELLKLLEIPVEFLRLCGILHPQEKVCQHKYDKHASGDNEDNPAVLRVDDGACERDEQDQRLQGGVSTYNTPPRGSVCRANCQQKNDVSKHVVFLLVDDTRLERLKAIPFIQK